MYASCPSYQNVIQELVNDFPAWLKAITTSQASKLPHVPLLSCSLATPEGSGQGGPSVSCDRLPRSFALELESESESTLLPREMRVAPL